jgi:hypothetical protein
LLALHVDDRLASRSGDRSHAGRGFAFSSEAFVWVKLKTSLAGGPQLISTDSLSSLLAVGKGKTTRKTDELCLMGKRDKPPRILAHDVTSTIFAPVAKPHASPMKPIAVSSASSLVPALT